MNVFVCLSVCFVRLSVCWHISKTTHPNFTKFYVHAVVCGCGPILSGGRVTARYILSVWGRRYFVRNRPDRRGGSRASPST